MKKQTYKKLFTVVTASAMAAGAVVAVAPTQADAASPFSDVKETNTHYANIVELTSRGVITGYEDGTYRPGNSINRANAAKIIAGVLGLDTTNVTNPGFSDVSVNNANYGSIAALANAGIINGFEGKFNPAGTLTRGQMSKIIDNAFNLATGDADALPFTDVQKSQYKLHIANLFANGVTTGVTATKFDEKSPVTRGQLASFVVRAEQAQTTGGGSETPGTETPGTTSTVEKAVTLLNVTNNLVTINGEQFDIAPEVAGVFNTDNAAALKDSETTLVIEYPLEPTASLANVAKKGKIVGVKSLKITQSGVTFDAKGYTIPSLSVTGNNVTLANVVTSALEVAAGNTVTLNGVTATTITVGKGAKITIDANTKLTTIKLAPGDKIENIIANYEAVKDQLKDLKVEGSTGSGGGGGGSTRPTTPVTDNAPYITTVESAIITVGQSFDWLNTTIDGSTLTIELTDTGFTVADAYDNTGAVYNVLAGKGTYGAVKSVTIGTGANAKTITADETKGFSKTEFGLAVVEHFFKLDPDKMLATLKDEDAKLVAEIFKEKDTHNSTLTVTFKEGTPASKTYTVIVKKQAK